MMLENRLSELNEILEVEEFNLKASSHILEQVKIDTARYLSLSKDKSKPWKDRFHYKKEYHKSKRTEVEWKNRVAMHSSNIADLKEAIRLA